jgi:signal transduction histidine kinase
VRLHSRIYLHFLLVLAVVGLTAAAVFLPGGPPGRELAERVVRHAAGLAAEGWPEPGRVQARLAQLHRDLGVDLTARGLDGGRLAAAGSELPPLSAEHAARVAAGETVVLPHRAVAGAPVHRDGRVAGMLLVSVHRRFEGSRAWRPWLGFLGLLLVVAAATRPLARRISRPLERLTEGTRRLGAGDLAHRVEPPAPRRRWRRRGPHGELDELTEAFNEMAARIQRLVAGQRELLTGVSHELRSPLARIRVALALVPRDAASAGRLAAVEEDLGELERLIDDLLTTARLEAVGLPAAPAPLALRPLLAALAARAARHPRGRPGAVRVADGPDLAAPADALLLERALWNLVDNALTHGAPPVVLEASREGDRIRLAVTDDGPGIPAADRARVLEPFATGDPARAPGGGRRGFGLGLTLARRVAEAHRGAIAIEAVARGPAGERGCRVVISLPASAP